MILKIGNMGDAYALMLKKASKISDFICPFAARMV